MTKIKVGILGATGMVGQRFVHLLTDHPWFEIAVVAASPASAGKSYLAAVEGRWRLTVPIPDSVKSLTVQAVEQDIHAIVSKVDLVFSALDLPKDQIRDLEEAYAQLGVAVVSNNSAHRWTEDVPMIMPEINPVHLELIPIQRKNRGWDRGLIVVKPNCSLQSYLPVVFALRQFRPNKVLVTTLQAVSGAGRTLAIWPEMVDNVIPFISGEEEKTEVEPLKILGSLVNGKVELAKSPVFSATCIRVPVSDGHLASVAIDFAQRPSLRQIREALENFGNPLNGWQLPSAGQKFIQLFHEEDRPQTRLDRDYQNGMGISCGRFRPDPHLAWKFIALSHNTVRGAAGGAILTAELLVRKGYVNKIKN